MRLGRWVDRDAISLSYERSSLARRGSLQAVVGLPPRGVGGEARERHPFEPDVLEVLDVTP